MELVRKPNQNMLTNLLWLQSTQMTQCLVLFIYRGRRCANIKSQSQDVRTTNHNLMHTYGRGQPRRQPPAGLGRARRARGGRPSEPPRRGRPLAPPAQHPTRSAEGWRRLRRGRGS